VLLLSPDAARCCQDLEKSWARKALSVGAFAGVEDALFGELGWELQLWTRVQFEAMMLAAAALAAPGGTPVSKVIWAAWESAAPTWAREVRRVMRERGVPEVTEEVAIEFLESTQGRRAALKVYRQNVLSLLREQDARSWANRVRGVPAPQWPIPYIQLTNRPFCQDVPLDPEALLHTEVVEWSRLRAGGTDFGESLCKRQMAHFVEGHGGCPFGCTEHTDAPAEFFARCTGIDVPRLLWKTARFGAEGPAPTDPEEILKELLHPPQAPGAFETNLRFVGHALRLRRGAGERAAQNQEETEDSESEGEMSAGASSEEE